MKNILKISLLFFVFLSLIISCVKDSDITLETVDNIPVPAEKIYATVNGLVLNAEEKVVENALVSLGTKEVLTDENGFFQIADFLVKDGAVIRVQRAGYYEAVGTIIPKVDATTKVNIFLKPIPNPQDFSSGRAIAFETDGGWANFPTDAFKDNAGNLYNGTVSIFGHSVDPTTPEFGQTQVGILATRVQNTTKLLYPFTFMRVELQSDLGQSLQLNKAVELTMDIPASLQADAPDEIPMWYMDTETGLWVEDGMATRTGNQYTGTVTHFTDWVFGFAFDYYTMTGAITQENTPFPFADIGIKYGGVRFGFSSDENGNFAIPVITYDRRIGESDFFAQFGIDVQSGCGKVIYEVTNLPRPTADFSKNLAVSSNEAFRVSGTLFCGTPDQVASEAYVLLQFDDSNYEEIITPNANGQFSFVATDCGLSNISLKGYNPSTSEKSNPVFVAATNQSVDIDVCGVPFSGGMTIEAEGKAPYFIPNADVFITVDTPRFTHYKFLITDYYISFEGYEGYKADYEVNIWSPDEGVTERSPFWYTWSQFNIWGGPIMYSFANISSQIISETDEKVIAELNFPGILEANKILIQYPEQIDPETGESLQEKLDGKITIEAFK